MGSFQVLHSRLSREDHHLGATEKIALAEKMRHAHPQDPYMAARGGRSQVVTLAVVFALAALFAMLLTDGAVAVPRGWRPTGIADLDRFFIRSDIPVFTGSDDLDRLVLVLLRGAGFFLLAALPAFLGFLLSRLFARRDLSPYVAACAANLAFFILLFFLRG